MPKTTNALTVLAVGGPTEERAARALLATRSVPQLDVALLSTDAAGYAPNFKPAPLAIETHTLPIPVSRIPTGGHAVVMGHCHPDETVAILEAADTATVVRPSFNAMGVAKGVLTGACAGEVAFAATCHRHTWAEMTELINLFPNNVELTRLRYALLGGSFLTRSPSTLRDNRSSFERMLNLKLDMYALSRFEKAVAKQLAKVDSKFVPLAAGIAAVSATDPDLLGTVIGCYQYAVSPNNHDAESVGKIVFAELSKLPKYTITFPDHSCSAVTAMLAKEAGLEPPDSATHRSVIKRALSKASRSEPFDEYAAAAKKMSFVVYTDPGLCPTLDDLFALAVLAAAFD